jgi:hypothetical protein
MAVADRGLGHSGNKGEHFSHLVELSLEFLVGRPRLEGAGKTGAITRESFSSFHHLVDFDENFTPCHILPLRNSVLDLGVEGVELIEELNLVLSLLQLGVGSVRKTEEVFTGELRVELALANGEFLSELAETLKSITRLKAGNHGALSVEVIAESFNIDGERVNGLDEVELVLTLFALELISDMYSLNYEFVPLLLDVLLLVGFFLVHGVSEVGLNQVVHIGDRLELEGDVGLLPADFLKGGHD